MPRLEAAGSGQTCDFETGSSTAMQSFRFYATVGMLEPPRRSGETKLLRETEMRAAQRDTRDITQRWLSRRDDVKPYVPMPPSSQEAKAGNR